MKIGHILTGRFNRLVIFINEDKPLDVNHLWSYHYKKNNFYNYEQRAEHWAPASLSKILKIYDAPLTFFNKTLELFDKYQNEENFFHKNYSLEKPLDQVGLYRDFYTHEGHVKTGHKKRGKTVPPQWYQMPVYYKGSSYNFIGPDQSISCPSYDDKLDYELELGLIVSRDGKDIDPKKAGDYFFGFTLLNDISARKIQREEMAVGLGPSKGKDFCSVIGPVIVTADEFNFSSPEIKMEVKINNTLVGSGMSHHAHYRFEDMLAFASKDEWVVSGDLIGSGTVTTGCALENDHWPNDGDTIELIAEKIGKIKNKIIKKG